MTRSKKNKRAAKAARGNGKREPTPRRLNGPPQEHLAVEGARRIMPLAGLSLTKARKPRLHALCGRVHAPGKCHMSRTSYGTWCHNDIVESLEDRWLDDNRDRLGLAA